MAVPGGDRLLGDIAEQLSPGGMVSEIETVPAKWLTGAMVMLELTVLPTLAVGG